MGNKSHKNRGEGGKASLGGCRHVGFLRFKKYRI